MTTEIRVRDTGGTIAPYFVVGLPRKVGNRRNTRVIFGHDAVYMVESEIVGTVLPAAHSLTRYRGVAFPDDVVPRRVESLAEMVARLARGERLDVSDELLHLADDALARRDARAEVDIEALALRFAEESTEILD